MNQEQRKVVALSAMGGMLEFYDFTIYGLFAVYFAAQFFPSGDRFAAIMATYAVFLIGYVARPIGGIIFSHIGDEIGRKTVLILTMVLMGVASLGIGFLPTYEKIGIWAPTLMVLLRLLQGLAIGGELPSTIVYVTESIPEQRGLAIGGTFAGALSGLIPGMLINIVMTHVLTTEQINAFGWRIPFILGGFLCFIAYQIRRKLHETSAFTALKQHDKFPLVELIRHHFGKLIIGIGLVSILATPVMLVLLFMPTYLIKVLNFPVEKVSNVIFCATILCIVSVYIAGRLTNRFSSEQLMKKSLIGLVIGAAVCYFMLYSGYNLMAAVVLFALFQGALVVFPLV
ncbi:MAG: MFS transporter, partial [Gammaproteobacteria bacterium]|nr:MFS transporter [Gammaproteobacteria bacterium]